MFVHVALKHIQAFWINEEVPKRNHKNSATGGLGAATATLPSGDKCPLSSDLKWPKWRDNMSWYRGPFLESSGNFSGLELCFKIKIYRMVV